MIFTVDDFIDCNIVSVRDRNFGDTFDSNCDNAKFKVFNINKDKDFIAFNKLYDSKEKGCVQLLVHESVKISECIPLINKHQTWLNSEDCKAQLINRFCEFVSNYTGKPLTAQEFVKNNWYDGLEINSTIILIEAGIGKINYSIGCLDKWHILYVNVEDCKIISAFDDYADLEFGTGYDGVW